MSTLAERWRAAAPAVDFCTLRALNERTEVVAIRDGVVQPMGSTWDRGAMITVIHNGGCGYAATADLSTAGLRAAAERAKAWAERTAGSAITDFSAVEWQAKPGSYATAVNQPWQALPLTERIALLQHEIAGMGDDPRIVERTASVMHVQLDSEVLFGDGTRIEQTHAYMAPDANVTLHANGKTQRRGFGFRGICQQGGYEVLERVGFLNCGGRLTEEGIALLTAPDCPTDTRDVVLAPDQMMLQIHESIGHPLELDRILGDERNYAGTSFVTPDMFGSYQYGSELLNVTFDPTVGEEFASYAFDDDGRPAERVHLIQNGTLVRPLGGTLSGHRSGFDAVANSRASTWNRPPIDRMANLNIEAGDTPFDALISKIERGVWMETNVSWSIDDSRNKFQFGCELGRIIEDGELKCLVRNPNYRGISATFWRNLVDVGDASTRQVLGTPYCGKGEPNQVIRVGHASPVCRFADVAVFGGEA